MNLDEIRRVAVIGAGLMGHGIAQECALAGYEVELNDLTDEKLHHALENIQINLKMLTDLGLITVEKAESVSPKIHTNTILNNAVSEADIVIEAVFENLELKNDIFRKLDTMCPEHTILASNSSTLIPSLMASVTKRPDRVLVTHYFNPPYLLPLVEVVRNPETSDETVNITISFLKKVGKSPAIVQKEVPGFIGNRLQAALLREALSIVQKGIASPQDVDIVVKNSFGRRLSVAGIFEIFDIAGWDIVYPGTSYLIPDIESSTEVSPLLKEKVERGELGEKTGRGFYDWTPESAAALKKRIANALMMIEKMSSGK
jgi:3-hydroxybutyryl-CoA dehydrogenase